MYALLDMSVMRVPLVVMAQVSAVDTTVHIGAKETGVLRAIMLMKEMRGTREVEGTRELRVMRETNFVEGI